LNTLFLRIAIIASIASLWVIFDLLNISLLKPLQVNDFLYAIYLLAGFRLLAVILFGWTGVIGVFLGYLLSGLLLKNFEIQDAICLGALSSIAPFIAYKIWQKALNKSESFLNVSFLQLFYLILLNSVLNAFLRSFYLLVVGKAVGQGIVLGTFAANISGSILFLFGVKAIFNLYKNISARP
jgi:hypothetical protein